MPHISENMAGMKRMDKSLSNAKGNIKKKKEWATIAVRDIGCNRVANLLNSGDTI